MNDRTAFLSGETPPPIGSGVSGFLQDTFTALYIGGPLKNRLSAAQNFSYLLAVTSEQLDTLASVFDGLDRAQVLALLPQKDQKLEAVSILLDALSSKETNNIFSNAWRAVAQAAIDRTPKKLRASLMQILYNVDGIAPVGSDTGFDLVL